jgi:multidrug efflux pump subunit AcrA (membrane-fusion protein)
MHGLDLHKSSSARASADPALEVARLEARLAERRAELSSLQEEFREFKARYAQAVGGPLAELAEVEAEIRRAEARMLGLEDEDDAGEPSHFHDSAHAHAHGKTGLRKLFWSVARMFHPDHASDEGEARRRHTIMAEASRAYRDGDVESLSTLLGDEQLQSYCASSAREDEPEDAAARLLNLKEELVTIEFGLKRLRQDRLYHLMLSAAEEARQGRDQLAQMADTVRRKVVKARNRLAHIS